MSRILSSLAWHHRKCSFRNSRVTTLGSRFRKARRLIRTSNLGQSGSRGRAAGLPAGGGGVVRDRPSYWLRSRQVAPPQ
eukprot:7129637-Pyramimonas_sp.AAC.1